MTAAIYKPVVEIYALATLKIPLRTGQGQQVTGALTYRYQNYQLDPFIYDGDGRTYEYLGFEAGLPPRRLELDSSQGQITIPNSQSVRDLYSQHNGLVEAIVFVRFIAPEKPEETICERKAQVISSDLSGAQISLELGSPIGLLDGNVLNRVFTSETFPGIATVLNVSVG